MKEFTKQIWSIFDLLIRPEQCVKCGDYMKPHLHVKQNDKDEVHEVIERMCYKDECKK